MKKIALIVAISIAVTGCATSSAGITATEISPQQYQAYDCKQLYYERIRVQNRLLALGKQLDKAAAADAGLLFVTLFLFWPAMIALGGTEQQEADYARLKGEEVALTQALLSCQPMNPYPDKRKTS